MNAAGPPRAKAAEPIAAPGITIPITNYGTIIIQHPAALGDRGLLPQSAGLDALPETTCDATATPGPSDDVACQDDPLDDAMPNW